MAEAHKLNLSLFEVALGYLLGWKFLALGLAAVLALLGMRGCRS